MRLALAILLVFSLAIIIIATYKFRSPNAMSPLQWIKWQWVSHGRGSESKNADQSLHHLINTVPIESIVLHSPKYAPKTRYGIVLLVISAQYEKSERDEIRKQWAADSESWMQRKGGSLVIFLVGRSSELEEEAKTYGDLLQVDIEETYRNLVYKIEIGFRWLKDHVQSEFVAKIDSDTVVHIDRLYGRLRSYASEQSGLGFQHWLACATYSYSIPIRDFTNVWYVPYSDYSSRYYPRYCNGPGYVMPRATFEKILKSMAEYKIIEVEDVFFTGLVTEHLKLSFIDRGITAIEYTEKVECDEHGPILSILNTHYQLGRSNKHGKDLTAAWKRLKSSNCPKL